MAKTRKIRCPHCGFLDTIKKGKRAGYSRYYCKNCESYFTDRREHITNKNLFIWFERWVRDKQSISQIAKASGYSERFLKNYFYKVCLILYRDSNIKMTILYRLAEREALRDLKEDLRSIKDVGIEIESVTCDGASNIIRAVQEVCPEAIIQRCTFHIANEICTWLTKKPKSDAARELRQLARCLSSVENHNHAQLWLREFIDWYNKYEEYINEKSVDEISGRWWYTHKMLHRSCTHIKRAIPNMFNYTRYTNIPKTSNSIESFFGHLKDHLRLHRGLSNEHFKDFVKWYLYLQSNQGKIAKKYEREK